MREKSKAEAASISTKRRGRRRLDDIEDLGAQGLEAVGLVVDQAVEDRDPGKAQHQQAEQVVGTRLTTQQLLNALVARFPGELDNATERHEQQRLVQDAQCVNEDLVAQADHDERVAMPCRQFRTKAAT